MKNPIAAASFFAAFILAPLCLAQTWEVGAAGGYGLYRNATASSTAGSAKVGFAKSAVVSVVGTQNTRGHFGGEVRYTYGFGGLKIGSAATMGGDSHAFTYELLAYGNRRGSVVRPFLAAGAGGKFFRGTGPEQTFQPLNGIAVLTATNEFKPVVSVGVGVKALLGKHGMFRIDVRDHASPFPTKVIAPRPPSGSVTGWLHDFVVMAGVSVTFSSLR